MNRAGTDRAQSRIACLYAPALPLQALLRCDPTLRGQPVVILGPDGRVRCASPEAPHVQPGMTLAQAQASSEGLAVRALSPAAVESARAALRDVAAQFSPLLECSGDRALLAVGDLRLLYPDERDLARALTARAAAVGLLVQVAIAGSVGVARVLAQARATTVVPPGADAAALAPLPVAALGLSAAQAQWLHRFGVATVGALAALPRKELAARLGAEGARLHALAQGQDPRPLLPQPPPEELRETLELESPEDNLEALAFLLRGLLDRLLVRLGLCGQACGDFRVRLRYGAAVDSANVEDRDIAVALPTRDGAALLALARLRLAAQPPRAPVCGLAVSTMPARPPEAQQLELLAPPGPRPPVPGRLLPALAQLAALCGEGRLGQPLRLSGHLPGLRGQAELSVQALLAPPGRTLRKDPPPDTPRPRRCAAHGVNPPRPARVERRGNALAWVRADGIDGEILCTGGPFLRRRGPLAATRLYYDVEVRGSGLLRLFREGEDWFLDARYE